MNSYELHIDINQFLKIANYIQSELQKQITDVLQIKLALDNERMVILLDNSINRESILNLID